jgi:hypothetical protein
LMMSRWQVALRCAAYLVVLVLGARWVWAAVESSQQSLFDTDAPALGALFGLKLQATLWLAAFLIGVKLMVGAYLLVTVATAAYAQARHGKSDPARLDASLLLSVTAVMLTAAPGLVALRVMPGAVDELTLVVIGIAFAALSRPEFLTDQPAAQPTPASSREARATVASSSPFRSVAPVSRPRTHNPLPAADYK